MFKRARIEIRLEGKAMTVDLNNLIRRVNRTPFLRIDAIHFYNSYKQSARILVSSPFRFIMSAFYVRYTEKHFGKEVTWL